MELVTSLGDQMWHCVQQVHPSCVDVYMYAAYYHDYQGPDRYKLKEYAIRDYALSQTFNETHLNAR